MYVVHWRLVVNPGSGITHGINRPHYNPSALQENKSAGSITVPVHTKRTNRTLHQSKSKTKNKTYNNEKTKKERRRRKQQTNKQSKQKQKKKETKKKENKQNKTKQRNNNKRTIKKPFLFLCLSPNDRWSDACGFVSSGSASNFSTLSFNVVQL